MYAYTMFAGDVRCTEWCS